MEAAGVEPACRARKPAATTCLVRVNCRPQGITPTRNLQLSRHGISRMTTRRLRCHPPRLIALTPRSRGQRVNVTALGCEGQLSVSFYFLVRLLTRPTNHPRHAASGVLTRSKPVRPHHSVLPSAPTAIPLSSILPERQPRKHRPLNAKIKAPRGTKY